MTPPRPDDRIKCLICGRSFRSLGPHLAGYHHTRSGDYLDQHGMPADTPLIAESLRRLLAQRRAATDADPDKAEPARQARRRAALRTVESAHQAVRDATEAKARSAGFSSMVQAIERDPRAHHQRRRGCAGRQHENNQSLAPSGPTQLSKRPQVTARCRCPAGRPTGPCARTPAR